VQSNWGIEPIKREVFEKTRNRQVPKNTGRRRIAPIVLQGQKVEGRDGKEADRARERYFWTVSAYLSQVREILQLANITGGKY